MVATRSVLQIKQMSHQVRHSIDEVHFYINDSCFSDSVFKIRLIRLGFSFQKKPKKFLYLSSLPTD